MPPRKPTAPADTLTAAEVLDLIVERSPALRAAGVMELELAGFKVKLTPHVSEGPIVIQGPERELSAMDDPKTFGLAEGAPVPGFAALRHRGKKHEDE